MNLKFNLNFVQNFEKQHEDSAKSTIFHVKFEETEYICAYYGRLTYIKFLMDSEFTRILTYKRLNEPEI
jgi:hypothetical protein